MFDGEKSEEQQYKDICEALYFTVHFSENPLQAENNAHRQIATIDQSISLGQSKTKNYNDNKYKLITQRYNLSLEAKKIDNELQNPKSCHTCGSRFFNDTCRSLHVKPFETFPIEQDKIVQYFKAQSNQLVEMFDVRKNSTSFWANQVNRLAEWESESESESESRSRRRRQKSDSSEDEEKINRQNEEKIAKVFGGDNIARFQPDQNGNEVLDSIPAVLTVPTSPVPAVLVPSPPSPSCPGPSSPGPSSPALVCHICENRPQNPFTKCKHIEGEQK